MSLNDPSAVAGSAGLMIIVTLVYLLLGLGIYLWYAWALSKMFPKIGAPSKKGWIPVVNEMEIFERGGIPGWNVIFYFIPVVQLYALYLRWQAADRINSFFGKSTAFSVLAVFVAPVWATLLALSKTPTSQPLTRAAGTPAPAPAATQAPAASVASARGT